MVNTKAMLTVLHDANGSFTDHSKAAADYQRDTMDLTLTITTGFLYIGFEKPFSACYADFNTLNTTANTLTAKYWNGSTWAALTIHDDTKGFTRNGFIQWDKPTDWASKAVNSITKYYIQISGSATTSAMKFNGLNIVYSDDQDLKEEFFSIDRLLPTGVTSFILAHVASRNQIIQELTDKGILKYDATNGYQALTPFDVLSIAEVRQASVYLTLSKILFDASDDPEGNLIAKAKRYEGLYATVMQNMGASIDTDNDGIKDEAEVMAKVTHTRINR